MDNKLSLVVLISGNGSNLQAIIDAIANKTLHATIRAVISNCADAYGLTRAAAAGIATHVIPQQHYANRQDFDHALLKALEQYQPELVVLAGFMRKIGPEVVQAYRGKMINIHPSLLPKYPGLHTHQKALTAKDQEHGVTIHFVTEDLDAGPIISQMTLAVSLTDTATSLQARIQQLEHKLYPETLRWFADQRVKLTSDGILIDGCALARTGRLVTL